MKKFIAIMVMLLIGLVANAQITVNEERNCYEFHLGGYVFSPVVSVFRGLDGFDCRVLYCETKDKEEAKNLERFIRTNVQKIEEKYGVVLWSPSLTRYEPNSCLVESIGNEVKIEICTKDYYDKKVLEIKKERAKAEELKEKRINSLNDIL